MYPFGSTTVSSIVNEGIFGIELMKYSDAVHKGKDEKRLRVDEGLFSIFVTAVLNLKQNSSKQYLLNKLLTILGKRNLISIQNNWFGIVCRISLEYESKDELQDFIEGDMSDFMVKGLVQDLHQKVLFWNKKKKTSWTLKILRRVLYQNKDAVYFYTEIIKWVINNPVLPNTPGTENFLENLAKVTLLDTKFLSKIGSEK
jgi:hypothetical protein